jgi:hypothetical protein
MFQALQHASDVPRFPYAASIDTSELWSPYWDSWNNGFACRTQQSSVRIVCLIRSKQWYTVIVARFQLLKHRYMYIGSRNGNSGELFSFILCKNIRFTSPSFIPPLFPGQKQVQNVQREKRGKTKLGNSTWISTNKLNYILTLFKAQSERIRCGLIRIKRNIRDNFL